MAQEANSSEIISLPHSHNAEVAILGCILLNPESIMEFTDSMKPEYFFHPVHQTMSQAMLELTSEGKPPEQVLVEAKMQIKIPHFHLHTYEGFSSFADLASDPINMPHWLHLIRKLWELREVIKVCSDISSRGRQIPEHEAETYLQEVEKKFLELAEKREKKGLRPAGDIVNETLKSLEQLVDNPQMVTGIPTGFIDLDSVTNGFQRTDLIILAARPAMGKTSLVLNFAANAAFGGDHYVAIFSLEMGSHQLMQRMLSTAARVEAKKFRNGQFDAQEFDRLFHSVQQFQNDRILIDDSSGITILDIMSRCRKVKREKGHIDMIIIDYLQLVNAGPAAGAKGSREQEISFISRSLKGLAKELNCPIIALSQLNRDLEKRPDKRPKPSDLRESGAIEQDADQIMFIYRDEVYHEDSPDKGIAEVIIGKNRHGETCTVKLAFQKEYTAFHNLAKF